MMNKSLIMSCLSFLVKIMFYQGLFTEGMSAFFEAHFLAKKGVLLAGTP